MYRERGVEMAYSGLNLGNVKNQNRSSILKLLNDHGPMPRKDLCPGQPDYPVRRAAGPEHSV